MVRRLALPVALPVALLALLAGCADGGAKDAARGPAAARSGAPESSPPPSEPPPKTPAPAASAPAADGSGFGTPTEARRTLRRLQRELFRAGRGGFATQVRMGSGATAASIGRQGSYDVAGLRSDYEMTLDTPEGRMRMRTRSQGSDAWFSFLELPGQQPRARCWVHVDTEVVEEVTEVRLPGGPGLGFPAEVSGFATARVRGFNAAGDLTADADLYTVAGAFGGQTPTRLGIPLRSRARVPIVVDLYQGELVGWYVELADVVEAAHREDYLPRPMARAYRKSGTAGLEGRLDVDFEDTGRAWRFDPPPAGEVIEMGLGESFETAMRTCTGLGQDGA